MTSIKALAESLDFKPIPSNYAYKSINDTYEPNNTSDDDQRIPTIDYSLLTSGTPDQLSQAILELGKACQEWGFFMLVNHGVPIEEMFKKSNEFFNLSEKEKRRFDGKQALDPIRCGTSFHGADNGRVLIWRDYLKVSAHPHFHFPNKPIGFSELASEYSKRTRIIARELINGVSESLGLEGSYMNKALNLDSGFQLFATNYYPPCPQPEVAIGIPPHTDPGLLTLLYQNGVGGLQILHNRKWVHINASIPNTFLVNTADQLEIFTNGKYKSVTNRAILNDKVTRMSLVNSNGPSLDTIVIPCSKFLDGDSYPAAYIPMVYKDYMELQQNITSIGIAALDQVRV